MGEGKTNMFGKTYNTIGSTDSNFLIKTKGDLKVQWGGKFIDIIKNGKLASAGADILKVATSSDEISSNGIYLVPTEEGNEVWISIDGTKVNLAGEVGTTYVSFLAEQKEVTADQKYTALTNAGFYYETLEQAKASGIKAGIIFVEGDGKLYVVKEGELQDYYLTQQQLTGQEQTNKFDEIYVGALHIYANDGYSTFDTQKMVLLMNGDQYLLIEDSMIYVGYSISLKRNVLIQSEGASENEGFRLYNTEEGSILEVDDIVWRNQPDPSVVYSEQLRESDIYSQHNNVIQKVINTQEIQDDKFKVKCVLKYNNSYQAGQYIYIYLSEDQTQYIIQLDIGLEDGVYVILAKLLEDKVAPELISIEVTYDDGSRTTVLNIQKGENSGQSQVSISNTGTIDKAKILAGPKNIRFEEQSQQAEEGEENEVVRDIETDEIILNKASAKEYEIIESALEYVTILVSQKDINSFLDQSINALTCLSSRPYIKIQGSNIDVLDRSKIITEEITNESGIVETVEKPDETIHTRIGTVRETDFQQLKECPEEQEEVNVGIYSDNFIGLNSKLYDPIFKKRCDFPKYDESIEVPEDFDDKKYDRAVPNIEWIKELIDRAVPKGTITMFNGASDIPVGWAVCDGTNGTPNLIGKFVKAVAIVDQIGDNPSELNENNELILAQEHLPKHSHPHKEHTHSLDGNISGTTGSSGDLTVALDYSDYNWGIEGVTKTFVTSVAGEGVTTESGTVDGVSSIKTQGGNATGGSHTHSISLATDGEASLSSTKSQEEELVDSEWPNNPIKIEPRSYSLIFIMKL